ncbi:hypothetical protein GCM10010885_15760 [Alicyclobacillus cellulosilyticus]|uniref:Helicase XPB/Ssl2 N-terminal domain-containing protein n=1 Tax=Alicyclobacillus cellulosilyticus TaxID=1003997 RepID=A0A917KAZ1_9BACL|nr:helicase-associated domain-containing protein [Alicyclobacillus cellulosilyticus]GGJ07451.1 hypothetical protein GCM10010885_15760 [Alicyclobacillus cellulosilyticus]
MRFADCLNAADITTLQRIAEHYGLSCSRHSKLSLIQEILYTFSSPRFLQEQGTKWLEAWREPLLRLCFEPRGVFAKEEICGMFQRLGEAQAMETATREGWLFANTTQFGRQMYCVPDELKSRIRQLMAAEFAAKLEASATGPAAVQEDGLAMARDLAVFLEYVRHHTVRLTADGSMYKRQQQQVFTLFMVPESALQGGWRFGYGRRFHDYPDRFALMYDFAYQQRLIDEGEDGILTEAEGSRTWLQMSEMERQRALFRFYLTSYRRPIPRLPIIVQLLALTAVSWVESSSALAALGDLVPAYYYDTREQVWSNRILKMLVHLGAFRRGCDEAGREWFQITQLGQQLITPDALANAPDEGQEQERILIIQPNFEIVATADHAQVLEELGRFAERKPGGVLRVYRVTEQSVRRGWHAGHSLRDWLTFLQRYGQTPVPGNVERTLREWERTMREEQGMMTS